jgi:hypothetical protein
LTYLIFFLSGELLGFFQMGFCYAAQGSPKLLVSSDPPARVYATLHGFKNSFLVFLARHVYWRNLYFSFILKG